MFTKFTVDVENVQALNDRPNANTGLTADQVKAVFDQAGSDIKDFINNTLTPELDSNSGVNLGIVNVMSYYASGLATTATGSITTGTKILTLTTTPDFVAGHGINLEGAREAASLQLTAPASASANCTVTLNGVAFAIALVSGDTAIQVATKIRAATYTGWTAGGMALSDTVTFTSLTSGIKTDAIYSAGTTGATGTMSTTTQGTDDQLSAVVSVNGLVVTIADNSTRTITAGTISHVDTVAIQSAINAAYGRKLIIPAGTYNIDPTGVDENHQGLSIIDSIDIEMDSDTILQCLTQSTTQFCVITIFNTSNVSITGGQIIGERNTHVGTTGEFGMGINIYHSTNILIEGVRSVDHWGDSLYIGGRDYNGGSTVTSNITIRNCVLNNSRRQGISITICDGVLIDNCRITNMNGTSPQLGIDIETNNVIYPCKNIVVRNTYFYGSVGGGFVSTTAAENIALEGCTFDGNSAGFLHTLNATVSGCMFLDADLNLRSSDGIATTGNIFDKSGVAITTNGASDYIYNIDISGNVFKNSNSNTSQKAITLTGGTDLLCFNLGITDNVFDDYISETIYLAQYATNVTIKGNQIKSDNVTRWVMLLRLFDSQVSNNSINLQFPSSAAITSIVSGVMIRGSFNNNNLNWLNVTVLETIMSFSDYTAEAVGATISGNVLTGAITGNPLKLPSSGTTKYKVMNNDFKFTNVAVQNASFGHYFYRNVFSTTSENGAIFTGSGDGSTLTAVIPHGLLAAPTSFSVLANNLATATAGVKFVTVDATNITVTFSVAPVSGSSNIKLVWQAAVKVFN